MKKFLKSKKGKLIIVLVIIVVIIGLLIRACTSAISAATGTAFVDTVEAQTRDLSETIALNGTIQGQSTTNVTSLASAKFTEVNVKVGDVVNAGDFLAALDPDDIKTQIAEVSSNVASAKALSDLATAQAVINYQNAQSDKQREMDAAKTTCERAEADYNDVAGPYNTYKAVLTEYNRLKAAADKVGTGTPEETALNNYVTNTINAKYTSLANVQSEIAKLEPQVQALARAKEDAYAAYNRTETSVNRAVESAGAAYVQDQNAPKDYSSTDALKQLKRQLEDCTLKAPTSGVVTSVKISVGDNNTPGAAVITISDTSTLVFSAMVDEKDIMKLSEGMNATLTTTAVQDKISGKITRIVRVKQAEGTTAGYPVEITIDNNSLLIGMNAKARIVMKEHASCLSIPYDHVQTDDDGNTYVMVAVPQDNGTYIATKKSVTVGEEINYFVEVTGGELEEGDLTFYNSMVSEGDTVYSSSMFDGLLGE